MLQDLAALTPPLIVCVAFLIGVGFLLRRELAPRRQARRDAAASPPGRAGSVSAAQAGTAQIGADQAGTAQAGAGPVSAAAHGLRPGHAAPGAGSAPREAETAPDRGDGSQT
jgi:hypothetical protein